MIDVFVEWQFQGFENNVAKSYNTIAVAPFTNMV